MDKSQRATLLAHINANTDPDVIAAWQARNDTELARLYNLDSSTIIWKPSLSPEEYISALDWTEVDSLTAGQARVWEWATGAHTKEIDPTDANLRAGIAQAFSAGTSPNTRAALLLAAKRPASVFEEVFASGGSGTEGDPSVSEVTGRLTILEIGKAAGGN